MKTHDLTSLEGEAFEEALDSYPGFCDVKDDPMEVLKEVDRLLKVHGLEIQVAEHGSPDMIFMVAKRKKEKK